MKRKKPINLDYIKKIEPLTDNQEYFFDKYSKISNMVAYGVAGTGKTFISTLQRTSRCSGCQEFI